MTRKEWLIAPLKQWHYYNDARKYFKTQIEVMKKLRPGVNVVLHHIDPADRFYETWYNVVPMWRDAHAKLHLRNYQFKKNETPWNKGLTSDSDIRIFNYVEQFKENYKNGKIKSFKGRIYTNRKRPGALSDETKSKISLANKGKIRTTETRLKYSLANKGKPWSEARRKAQEARNQGKEG